MKLYCNSSGKNDGLSTIVIHPKVVVKVYYIYILCRMNLFLKLIMNFIYGNIAILLMKRRYISNMILME